LVDEDAEQPLARLALVGEGSTLRPTGGCQADPTYQATYDNPQGVGLHFSSISEDPVSPRVSFIDLFGKLMASYRKEARGLVPSHGAAAAAPANATSAYPSREGSSSKGPRRPSLLDKLNAIFGGGSTYPVQPTATTPGHPPQPCELTRRDVRERFGAAVNQKLASAHVGNDSLSCAQVADQVDIGRIAPANVNIWSRGPGGLQRCKPFIEDAAEQAEEALGALDTNGDRRVDLKDAA
jgi:hypothetical protein